MLYYGFCQVFCKSILLRPFLQKNLVFPLTNQELMVIIKPIKGSSVACFERRVRHRQYDCVSVMQKQSVTHISILYLQQDFYCILLCNKSLFLLQERIRLCIIRKEIK